MKYFFAKLDRGADLVLGKSAERRLAAVIEREDNEPGMMKVLRKTGWSSEKFQLWVTSDSILSTDEIVEYPDDSGGRYENYRCVLVGVDPMKDRSAIKSFYERHFSYRVEWFEVSKEVFEFIERFWYASVLGAITDPTLDFVSTIAEKDAFLSPDDKILLKVGRFESVAFPPKVTAHLRKVLTENNVNPEIQDWLLTEVAECLLLLKAAKCFGAQKNVPNAKSTNDFHV